MVNNPPKRRHNANCTSVRGYFDRHPEQWSLSSFTPYFSQHNPKSSRRALTRYIRTSWKDSLTRIAKCRGQRKSHLARHERATALLQEFSTAGAPNHKDTVSLPVETSEPVTVNQTVNVHGNGRATAPIIVNPGPSTSGPSDLSGPSDDDDLDFPMDDDPELMAEEAEEAEERVDDFSKAFSALDDAHKWKLKCGTVVEDKLYAAFTGAIVLPKDVRECIRNWIIDVDSPDMAALFKSTEWEEIQASLIPLVPVPKEFAAYLAERFGPGKIESIAQLRTVVYASSIIDEHDPDASDLRWANQALLLFADLLEFRTLEDLGKYAEHWFDTNVWGTLFDHCLWSVPDLIVNRADLQCKASVLRKNRDRRAKDRFKPALKHDGVVHDRITRENEFGLLECSPLQSTGEHSSKWLGDHRKMRKPLRDMLSRLILAVKHNRRQVQQLQVFGFNFSALTLQVSRLTQPKGYVCLFSTNDSVSVPRSLQQLPQLMSVLCHVVQIKRAVAGVVEAFGSRSTNDNPDAFLEALLSLGGRSNPDRGYSQSPLIRQSGRRRLSESFLHPKLRILARGLVLLRKKRTYQAVTPRHGGHRFQWYPRLCRGALDAENFQSSTEHSCTESRPEERPEDLVRVEVCCAGYRQ